MTSFRKLSLLVALGILVLAFAAQPARADSISLNLGVPNTAISGYPGPYGTVEITLTSATTATVELTALSNYLFGDGCTLGLSVNGTATTDYGAISSTVFDATAYGKTFTAGPFSTGINPAGKNNCSDCGSFNFAIDDFDGFYHSVTGLTFTLTATGSTTWSGASDVLVANNKGYLAVGHVFVPLADYSAAAATGFACNGGGGPCVPDGGMTMTLLGLALAGLGVVARRLK